VITTWTSLINEVLNNGGPDHSSGTKEETKRDLLESAKVDAGAAEGGIDL
jgi:hypothetical protein